MLSKESLKNVPIYTSNVKSHTKVEAFVLMAVDLKHVQTKFRWIFRHVVAKTDHLEKLLITLAVTTIVKALQRHVKEGKNMKPHDPQSAPSSSGGGNVDASSRV
ncbi:hypothetical protein L484_004274 [Morus notabilis]|uniref:Uncharacterized protein n=1 Tax=Morus notabilis TaxID=981085 RepID=W9R258_9ROSA|nr:hypothetical protein L484_004274 [Morus notabilis]